MLHFKIFIIIIIIIILSPKVLLSEETDTVVKTRALSNMADLLGAMAGPYGGLRSGPGSNPAWSTGFSLLMVLRIIWFLSIILFCCLLKIVYIYFLCLLQ